MIYTVEKDRYLKYNTPLIEYIKRVHLYNNENLIYSNKYSGGTFSITNPDSKFINCDFINGYPHFQIPLQVCVDEIEFFLNGNSMYDNNFYIRYGDTHPDKSIPKLAQVRNLLVENSLSSMIGENVTSFYGLGDISLKSLKYFIEKNNYNYTPEELFVMILNNTMPNEVISNYEKYDMEALENISKTLEKLNLVKKNFLIESRLYKNQDLHNLVKNNPSYAEELKDNGELKYSLQELICINSIVKNNNDILINIIGADQSAHVAKVNELLNGNFDIKNRFLTYEICRNADERNIDVWSKKIIEFIEKYELKINGTYIDFQELLKIIVIINSNDLIFDYENLIKYRNNILKFSDIISKTNQLNSCCEISDGNHLIHKMALVGYNLNRAIEMGSQSNFYRYLLTVVNEYESNPSKYQNIEGLYKDFVVKCIDRLGYKSKCKVKEFMI